MTVEPIRDKTKIKNMFQLLKGYNSKYAMLFKFGINTGLRISDILPLKINNIFTEDMKFKEHLILKEIKTGKEKKIKLNEILRKTLLKYVTENHLKNNDYIFYSQKGGHLGRIQVYRVFKETARVLGIENFGTHSLRKTWGYWTYKMSKYNIGLIMDTLNHSSERITLRYIGVNQEQKDDLYSMVQL